MQKFLLLVFVFIFILLRSLHRLVHNKSTIFSVQGIFTLSSKCKRKSSALPRRSLCLVCWRRMKWKKNAFFSDFFYFVRGVEKKTKIARESVKDPTKLRKVQNEWKKIFIDFSYSFFLSALSFPCILSFIFSTHRTAQSKQTFDSYVCDEYQAKHFLPHFLQLIRPD